MNLLLCRTPSTQDIVSPRVASSSGSRRRKRRKNSQSDSKRQSSGIISPIPHCTSPVEMTPTGVTVSEGQAPATTEDDSPELFTPVSSCRKPSNNMNSGLVSSGKADKARARLLSRFESAESQESGDEVHGPPISNGMANETAIEPVAERESPRKPAYTQPVVQAVPTGRFAKGGWANLPKM